ncbi:thermonuclease family protein [Caulobacter segnis]|uniref:thermonuclease family protein n=1 Tax=Caulobacter segnis TaxID=88688 RepID=UPI00240FC847|nr:thermonuclease family protein [Caulobacter segnis]MDG2522337.1 thermonuclease family protein [Caulobacter segnis]
MRVSKPLIAFLVLAGLIAAGWKAYDTAKPRVHPIKVADAQRIAAAEKKYGAGAPQEVPAGDEVAEPADPVDRRTELFGPARAVDGDTLLIQGVEADLWTIDAPELAQTCLDKNKKPWTCGEASREHLEKAIAGRKVACRPEGPPPRDGRWLGLCFVAEAPCSDPSQPCESDLKSLNLAQVRNGWAMDFEGQYSEPESDAQKDKAGLWVGSFDPPEKWRELNPQAR